MHLDNPGRFNMSVADSSFDTWLDGYVAGIPGRKVSIYTEGCLLAFILDVKIMKATANKSTIHDLMKILYERTALKSEGYSEEDYKKIAEEVCGENLDEYFDKYVNGTSTIEGLLTESFDHIGLYISKNENPNYSARKLGFRHNSGTITSIA